jgi:hypothetical protein
MSQQPCDFDGGLQSIDLSAKVSQAPIVARSTGEAGAGVAKVRSWELSRSRQQVASKYGGITVAFDYHQVL